MVKKNNNYPTISRILIAPLNWGLGHATRCIPLIHELIEQNCEVFIAAKGPLNVLLKSEFPDLKFLPIEGYRLKFTKSKKFVSWKTIIQFPGISYQIYKEHRLLKQIVKQYNINAVISDNRFGLFNKEIYSVYITHQLAVKTGNAFMDKAAKFIHEFFVNKYNECWVPDFENYHLAGDLSHPERILKNVRYIGALSRFEKANSVKKKYDLLILLSGPEPYRTILEKLMLQQIKVCHGRVLFVRGLPGDDTTLQSNNASLKMVNYLPAQKLGMAIQEAEIIIGRSGYTTVMDLIKLNKKAILIPTPGQTEQLYLASYLMKKNIFFSEQQERFELTNVLEKFSKFSFDIPVFDMNQYKIVIQQFAQGLRQKKFVGNRCVS